MSEAGEAPVVADLLKHAHARVEEQTLEQRQSQELMQEFQRLYAVANRRSLTVSHVKLVSDPVSLLHCLPRSAARRFWRQFCTGVVCNCLLHKIITPASSSVSGLKCTGASLSHIAHAASKLSGCTIWMSVIRPIKQLFSRHAVVVMRWVRDTAVATVLTLARGSTC